MVSPTSRYANVGTATHEADGRKIVYLRRRFVPLPSSGELIALHTVGEGERLDVIAARYFDDPELFWLLCDANQAMYPAELEGTPGRRLAIPLPQ